MQPQQLSPYLTLLDPQVGEAFNLKPLHSIRLFSQLLEPGGQHFHLALLNLLGNLLIFLPYGFLGRLLLRNKGHFRLFFSGLFCILLIEFLQLLTGIGVWDIDDILLNTLGLILGLILAKPFIAFQRRQ
ncbi:MAG: VanZ family protein [Clostridiales bacterium]|nr:VanZ family protein [Clostridiales bacterium]